MVLPTKFVAKFIELILLELWKEPRGQRIQKFKDWLNLVEWKRIVAILIGKDRNRDILTSSLKLVAVALVCD